MPAVSGSDVAGARVVIAANDAASLKAIEESLAPMNYRMITALDGQEAYNVIRRDPPDLALLDINLPGMGGIEICRRMKRNPRLRLIPVILLTSAAETGLRLESINSDADDYLLKPIAPLVLQARSRSLIRMKRLNDNLEYAEDVLFSMAAAVEAKDTCTRGHTMRVAKLSQKIGAALNFAAQEMEDLRKGAILHDIGKIGIPDAILNKADRLTPEERTIMMSHPALGFDICSPLRFLSGALDIVRHHHERLDGSGYPDGLKGEQIARTVRVMAAVDVFDALRSDRPYKKALPMEAIEKIMRQEAEKGYWDAQIVETMLRVGKDLPFDVTQTPIIRPSAREGEIAPLAL